MAPSYVKDTYNFMQDVQDQVVPVTDAGTPGGHAASSASGSLPVDITVGPHA